MEIRYLGNKNYLNELKKQGIKNPEVEQKKETSQHSIATGDLQNNSFSFSFKINNDTNPAFSNMEFKGHCKIGEYPKLSSMISSKLDKKEKKAVLDIIQESIKQTPVLTKKLKINDSFTTSTPLKIPLENLFIEMKVITRYTLKEIKNDTAYFDYAQNYSLNMALEEINLTGKGNGKGKATYGINEHFFLANKSEANIEMGTNYGDKSMQLRMKINSEENTSIK
jgi:hypothetical protein